MTKKIFSAELSKDILDMFTKYVFEHGYTKYRALEGALQAFIALPTELQVKLMQNNVDDVYGLLVEGLVDAELAKEIDALGPAKDDFLKLLKQAKARVSRKK